jgi:hypothetical protein
VDDLALIELLSSSSNRCHFFIGVSDRVYAFFKSCTNIDLPTPSTWTSCLGHFILVLLRAGRWTLH